MSTIQELKGWSLGIHGKNRKYFHYLKDGEWLCGKNRAMIPTPQAVNLGLASLHFDIDPDLKCKKCAKLLNQPKLQVHKNIIDGTHLPHDKEKTSFDKEFYSITITGITSRKHLEEVYQKVREYLN